VELVSLVVFTFTPVFSCTKTSEVFTGFWDIFEKLKNNTFFDIVFLAFVSNCKIKENLRVFWVKLWKSCLFVANLGS
jgi:hypothetical protein